MYLSDLQNKDIVSVKDGKKLGHIIDAEIKKIIDKAYNTAREILSRNIDKLHIVAGILLEREKIDGEEFNKVFED